MVLPSVIVLAAISFPMLASSVLAEWGPAMSLSGGGAVGSPGGTHPIVAKGNTVHAVWWAKGNIYYRWSTDAGVTWTDAAAIVTSGTASYPCSLELSDSALYLIWPDSRDGGKLGGNLGEIYLKRSTDGGKTWGPEMRVAPDMRFFRFGTTLDGNSIHVAWNEQGDPIPNLANYRWYKGTIYYKVSADGGATWGPNVQLTAKGDFDHGRPAIAASGKYVHTGWIDGRDAVKEMPWDQDIYYSRSTDGGATWGENVRMNNDPGDRGWHPQIVAVPGGQVCLIYEMGLRFDLTTKTWSGDSALYVRLSRDNGATWDKAKRITFVNAPNGRATHSKAYVSGSRIHLVWTDASGTDPAQKASSAYYITSPDGGLTWGEAQRLTSAADGEAGGSGVAGTESYAVVLINRGETIYYRRCDLK